MTPTNADKPHLWKEDIERSIDFYNDWFVKFAPETFRIQRARTAQTVAAALAATDHLRRLTPEVLSEHPGILPVLRMATAPPLARDRLIGLAHATKSLVEAMEGKEDEPPRLPPRMRRERLSEELSRIADLLTELADRDLFPWMQASEVPTEVQIGRASIVVADRLCGAAADPIIRNAQERRQLASLRRWLTRRGYRFAELRSFALLLCGYFGPDYLGYEAAEGFDWIWEHRLADLVHALTDPAEPSLGATPTLREEAPYSTKSRLETNRGQVQQALDAERSAADRNRLGQFATPPPLAAEIVRRAVSFLPGSVSLSVLEPACGTGVFFSALQAAVPRERIACCQGVELDPRFAAAARELWHNEGVKVEEADFFEFAAQDEHRGQFNLLCTNPPYVRHHHIRGELKRLLQTRAASEIGLLTSGLTGLYVYFVLLADPVLAEGGIASWLIPSEFLVVNYGAPLREYLRTRVTLLEVFQFDPEETQFDDALVSSCIVTYRKTLPPSEHTVQLRFGADYADAAHQQRVPLRELAAQSRWQIAPVNPSDLPPANTIRVGDLFTVRRGIATGANDFFVMTQEQSRQHGLPMDILRPVLTSPRQLKDEVIDTDAAGVPRISERLFLLDCALPAAELTRRYPSVWAYLEGGRQAGVADGYLCRSRSPWYAQEQRPRAPYLVSYMGRSTSTRENPFRFFLNRSRATATNGFLCLYPKPRLAGALDGHPEREVELLQILNRIAPETLKRNGRSYGGGLHKVEPSELLSLPLPELPPWLLVASPEPQLTLLE